jgi:hypothetical protein
VLKKRFSSLLFTICLLVSVSVGADDRQSDEREYQLKIAYLLHFVELTEWPDLAPVTICLLGKSPLKNYLPVLDGLDVHGQTLHVDTGDFPLRKCSMLFLSDSGDLTKSLLTLAQSRHVLLVGDAEDFARKGGMIQFVRRNDKLKLIVNLSSARQAGLKLSSKLLRMAEILE